jgi:hypothetical protein
MTGWKYSLDSLWMKTASGRTSRIASCARRLARTRWDSAFTKASSERSCSFHQPSSAENVAQT